VKVRSTVDGQRGVTIWLPIDRWPVVSVSVVAENDRKLLWSVIHESFSEAEIGQDEPIELTITQTSSANPLPQSMGVSNAIPLRYGHAPDGMRQTVPQRGFPLALQHGDNYTAVVRENVVDGVRWFEFNLDEK
jgi:hypothetical protein